MSPKSKYNYLVRNTLLFTISSFGSKLLTFLLVPLYTHVLSTAEYGISDLITTTANLVIFVFTLNIADAVMRFAIEKKERQEEILVYGLKVLAVGSVIFAVTLMLLWIFHLINWAGYCYLFLFLDFFLLALNQILLGYLRAVDDINSVAVSGITTTFFTIVSNLLLLVVFKIGMIGYMASVVIGYLASDIYCAYKIRLPFGIQQCDPNTRRAMRKYSIPLIFNGVAWWMNSSIDKYFVTAICGVAQNGIYSVAYKIPTILTVFQSIFSQAWNLSAIREYDQEDREGFFANIYSIYNAGLVFVCSGLILFNIPLAKFLFSKDFFTAWRYSSVLLISIVFSALSSFLGSIFAAVKDSRITAVSTVAAACVNMVLNAVLIPFWGVQGAAIATMFSFCVVWFIRLECARKYIHWHLNLKKDICAYILLVLQVILEHLEGHMYIGQMLVVLVIFVLYRKHFFKIAKLLIGKFYV